MHVPIWELQDILRESSQHSESSIISLALLKLPQQCLLKFPLPEMRIGQWVQITWGWEHILPKLGSNVGKPQQIQLHREIRDSNPKKAFSRIPIQGVLAESMVVSPKIDFSPLQVGGMGSTGSCICNMRIYMY